MGSDTENPPCLPDSFGVGPFFVLTTEAVMEEILKGTITNFGAHWGSGIAFIEIDGIPIPCENTTTIRSLDGAFPGFIGDNHCVDTQRIIGEEIYYSTDGFMLDGFTPVDEASEELIEAYESNE